MLSWDVHKIVAGAVAFMELRSCFTWMDLIHLLREIFDRFQIPTLLPTSEWSFNFILKSLPDHTLMPQDIKAIQGTAQPLHILETTCQSSRKTVNQV